MFKPSQKCRCVILAPTKHASGPPPHRTSVSVPVVLVVIRRPHLNLELLRNNLFKASIVSHCAEATVESLYALLMV